MKLLLRRIILIIKKTILDHFIFISKRKFIFENIPYFYQKDTGIKSLKEHLKWKNNGCGMVCLKSILAFKTGKVYPLYKLGRLCEKYGGYVKNPKSVGGYDGLFYKPFLIFIKKEFGLDGKVQSTLTIKEIIKYLSQQYFVIASVSSEIADLGSYPSRKEGHLVLLAGYNLDEQTVIFNNTGFSKRQEHQKVKFRDFEKYFSNKGIIIY